MPKLDIIVYRALQHHLFREYAEMTIQLIAARVSLELLCGQHPGINHALTLCVILSYLCQGSIPQKINAAVTEVGIEQGISLYQYRAYRTAHATRLFFSHNIAKAFVSANDGFADELFVGIKILRQLVQHSCKLHAGFIRCALTVCLPAHSIANCGKKRRIGFAFTHICKGIMHKLSAFASEHEIILIVAASAGLGNYCRKKLFHFPSLLLQPLQFLFSKHLSNNQFHMGSYY